VTVQTRNVAIVIALIFSLNAQAEFFFGDTSRPAFKSAFLVLPDLRRSDHNLVISTQRSKLTPHELTVMTLEVYGDRNVFFATGNLVNELKIDSTVNELRLLVNRRLAMDIYRNQLEAVSTATELSYWVTVWTTNHSSFTYRLSARQFYNFLPLPNELKNELIKKRFLAKCRQLLRFR
jgi:hypothetical protein